MSDPNATTEPEISEKLLNKAAYAGYKTILDAKKDSIGISDPRVANAIQGVLEAEAPALAADYAMKKEVTAQCVAHLKSKVQVSVEKLAAFLRGEEFQRRLALALPDGLKQNIEKVTEKAIFYVADPEQGNFVKMGARAQPEEYGAAVLKLAAMGLYPDHLGGSGWITQRFDKRRNADTLVAVPGVRGMEEILANTGELRRMEVGVVREQDTFEYSAGTETRLTHVPKLTATADKPNQIVASWCIIQVGDRDPHIAVKPVNQKELAAVPGFMDAETRAKYLAQRACMREVMRMLPGEQYGMMAEAISETVETAEESAKSAEGVADSSHVQHAKLDATTTDVVTEEKVEKDVGEVTHDTVTAGPEGGREQTSSTAAEANEEEHASLSEPAVSDPEGPPQQAEKTGGNAVEVTAAAPDGISSQGATKENPLDRIVRENAESKSIRSTSSESDETLDPSAEAKKVFRPARRRRAI